MFKVGQTVWCVLCGRGQVVEVINDTRYPVLVKFVNGCESTYTMEGHYNQEFQRTLFFSEPVITAETEPPFEPTLKNGEMVVVAESSTSWVGLFLVQKENRESVSCFRIGTCSPVVDLNKKGHSFRRIDPEFLKLD